MAGPKHVLLAYPVEETHLARTLRGTTDYARGHGGWTFGFSPEWSSKPLRTLSGWTGDGIFMLVTTKGAAQAALDTGLPVVNLSGWLRDAGLPRVMVDQEAVGRLAAEHLLGCGFQRFAYYGIKGVWYARQRGRGFIQRVEAEGRQCSVLETPSRFSSRRSTGGWLQPLEQWLKTLTTPVGLMAAFDVRATMVVDACARLGLRVPDDVAVVGVDNNDVTCELCQTPLSSVSRNPYLVGWEAAALLDRLMAGEPRPEQDVLVAPDAVVQRRSTDVLAIEDAKVAAAAQFVRRHVNEPFGIERLLPLVGVSRRWLTHRFKQCLGTTPYEFICQTRVQRAKELLTGAETLPLGRIAEACGFTDTRRFRLVFERLTGITPAEYRRSHQAGG